MMVLAWTYALTRDAVVFFFRLSSYLDGGNVIRGEGSHSLGGILIARREALSQREDLLRREEASFPRMEPLSQGGNTSIIRGGNVFPMKGTSFSGRKPRPQRRNLFRTEEISFAGWNLFLRRNLNPEEKTSFAESEPLSPLNLRWTYMILPIVNLKNGELCS